MHSSFLFSRRTFIRLACLSYLSVGAAIGPQAARAKPATKSGTKAKSKSEPKSGKRLSEQKLRSVEYGQVELFADLPKSQRDSSIATLLAISDDSLLKPFRERAGLSAPGADLGGWYDYFAGYDWQNGVERGFAPGHCFGQWLSALARAHATDGGAATKVKVESLVKAYSQAITPLFFKDARFPAYTYDKLVIGLIDAHRYAECPGALVALEKTTEAALPYLPELVVDRETQRAGLDASYTWDEAYTLPENLFIAYNEGAGARYLELAKRFLLDRTYFEPLAAGQNVLTGKHAYSYTNALGSAMQAYLTLDSAKHLAAAVNAFDMIQKDQSFATGGWGPDELFQKPGTGALGLSLERSHQSFETPCGAYAHLKLTNYLTCVTADSRFGDSAELIIYNTVLGAKPLEFDGRAFYYSDYNNIGSKVYSTHRWPCCAGTLPQVACDYGKHAYFLDNNGAGIYVNLYLNSAVNWQQQGRPVTLRQTSNYPRESQIAFVVETKWPSVFTIQLRIPAWTEAEAVTVRVNGELLGQCGGESINRSINQSGGQSGSQSIDQSGSQLISGQNSQPTAIKAGSFFAVTRAWMEGDRLELSLPLPLRLEKVDDQHPHLVALLCGPRVLFAVKEGATSLSNVAIPGKTGNTARNEPVNQVIDVPINESIDKPVTEEMLLTAKLNGDLDEWLVVDQTGRKIRLLPFTAIGDETYTTYLNVR